MTDLDVTAGPKGEVILNNDQLWRHSRSELWSDFE